MKSKLDLSGNYQKIGEIQDYLARNSQFWSIASIFILITLHHYDNLTSFSVFSAPDLPLGLTRHTIDRILYLVPIFLSSFAFGSQGGKIAVTVAFLAMLPRALFISESPMVSVWEMVVITMIGGSAPLALDHYKKQEQQFKATKEKLEITQRELLSKVQLSKEQERQLHIINIFARMFSRPFEMDQLMRTTIDMVLDAMKVEIVLIFSSNKGDENMRLSAYKGISEDSAKCLDSIKQENCSCGRTGKADQCLVLDDTNNSLVLQDKEGLCIGLSVPLVAIGKVMGRICIATREKRQFKELDIELLSAFGNLIGVAMRNAYLYHEKEGAIKQLEHAINQLKLSENKYRKLFENAHDAIWVQDPAGQVMAANQAAAELFGRELSGLIGTNIERFLPPEDSAFFKKMHEDILSRKSERLPYKQKIIKNDGTEAFVMLTVNRASTDDKPDGFQFIGKDITREVRMQQNQSFYLKQITKGYEEERQRISRDLHDSTAQNLIATLRQLERFIEENAQLKEEKLAVLWGFHRRLKESLQEIRRVSRDLRPSVLDNLGLFPAVEWLTEQLKNEYGADVDLVIEGEERRFTSEIEITLFRIIQEALRNIAKHAEATKCRVAIELTDIETKVTITDDGKGFELPATLGDLSLNGKLGIDGMQTRAKLAGGTFDIASKPKEGTTIFVTIPA